MAHHSRNILAIDTSGSFCSVAVLSSGGRLHSLSSGGSGDHFEQLPHLVGRVCADAGISSEALHEVRIGCGPGSFTGLRIGASFAKGLAWSLRIPLVGVSSFAGAASAAFSQDADSTRVVVVADARRDEVFIASYLRGSPFIEENSPQIVPVAALSGAPWTSSSGSVRWSAPQRDLAIPGVSLVPECEIAKGIVLLPVEATGEFQAEKIAMLEPTYLRAVAAKTIEERKAGT